MVVDTQSTKGKVSDSQINLSKNEEQLAEFSQSEEDSLSGCSSSEPFKLDAKYSLIDDQQPEEKTIEEKPFPRTILVLVSIGCGIFLLLGLWRSFQPKSVPVVRELPKNLAETEVEKAPEIDYRAKLALASQKMALSEQEKQLTSPSPSPTSEPVVEPEPEPEPEPVVSTPPSAPPTQVPPPSPPTLPAQVKTRLAQLGTVYFPPPSQTVTSNSVTSDQYGSLSGQAKTYPTNSQIKNTGNCSLVTGHCFPSQIDLQLSQTYQTTERQFNESDFALNGNPANVSEMSYLTTTGEVEAETRYTSAWGLSGRLSPKFYITLKEPLKNNFGRAAIPKGSLLVATLNPNADPGMVVLNAKYFEVGEQQIPIPNGAVEINSANGTPLVAKFESQNTQSFFQLDWQKLTSIGAIAADLAGVQRGATSILAAGNLLTRQQPQRPSVPPVSYYLLEEGRELKVKITKRIPLPSLVEQQKGNK